VFRLSSIHSNKKFHVCLVFLPLSHLDVILGVDWLSSNQILLNYAKKSLIFPYFEDLLNSSTNSVSEYLKNEIQVFFYYLL